MLAFNELLIHTIKQLLEEAHKESLNSNHTGKKSKARPQPLEALRFVVLDIETTGFYPARGDEIISVGACVVGGGKIREGEIFSRLVNPCRSIPRHITELTGITGEMAANGGNVAEVLSELLDFIGEDVIVGHVVEFDLSFINYKMKQKNINIRNKIVDTSILARALYPWLENYSLDSLLNSFNIQPEGRHTALGDAFLTALLLEKFFGLLGKMGVDTLSELEWLINHCRQNNILNISF